MSDSIPAPETQLGVIIETSPAQEPHPDQDQTTQPPSTSTSNPDPNAPNPTPNPANPKPTKRRGRPPGRPNTTVKEADFSSNPLVQLWNASRVDPPLAAVVAINIRDALSG